MLRLKAWSRSALGSRFITTSCINQIQVLDRIDAFRKVRRELPANATLGLVPTMGGLHNGHKALVENAQHSCDFVAVSLFVNPTQFGPTEDYSKYPRTFETDVALLTEMNVDYVFHPSVNEMYSRHARCHVDPVGFDDLSEGHFRKGHFRGVATVVLKLLNIVQPTHAFFGQKDAAQVVLIKRMVSDLNVPVQINVVPIVRDVDGLALSTRNQYLSQVERKGANVLYRGLLQAQQVFENAKQQGKTTLEAAALSKVVCQVYERESLVTCIDYVSVGSKHTMEELSQVEIATGAIISVAVKLGHCRLIDNIVL